MKGADNTMTTINGLYKSHRTCSKRFLYHRQLNLTCDQHVNVNVLQITYLDWLFL